MSPPADPDARVCVVATRPATFERCRDGLYPVPADYERATAEFEYMALYRTAPVSAITHVARVGSRTEQTGGEEAPMSEADWEATIDPFSDTEQVVVFEFEELSELETPVENDLSGVRGAWYCRLADLHAAETLSELSASAE